MAIRYCKLLFTLALTVSARADIVTATFSGNWALDAGLIHAGDPFSGSASWDTFGITGLGLEFMPVQAFETSTFPGIFEQSNANLWLSPDLYMQFKSAVYFNGNLLSVETIYGQRNLTAARYCAANDTNGQPGPPEYYSMMRPGSAEIFCTSRLPGLAAVTFATNYQFTVAPQVATVAHAPEPGTLWMVALVLIILAYIRRPKTAPNRPFAPRKPGQECSALTSSR